MKQMVFIMGKSETETTAVELIVIEQKEQKAPSGDKLVISKVLDLRNLKPVEGGAFLPFKYVLEHIEITGYPTFCQFISEEQVKTQYPWFF